MHNAIKSIRTKNGMSQADVAKSANISLRAYINYEQNKRLPDVIRGLAIAKALNSTVEELFNAQMSN